MQAIRRAAALLCLVLPAGCATVPPVPSEPAPGGSPPAAARPTVPAHLEERALLLLLVDRQIYEPYTVEQSLLGDAALRGELALALGRIPDPRAAQALLVLLDDPAVEVRRAAAFALGLHPGAAATSRPPLQRLAAGADRAAGALAVESLARQESPLGEVLSALAPLAASERQARLLPALFRFQEEATVAVAVAGLEAVEPALRARAAYALARHPRPSGAPHLRRLLADENPWVRGWAARGLGQVGEGGDLAAVGALLGDPEPGPVIQALRAAVRLIGEGKAAPPEDWRRRLFGLLDDPRPGVRLTAIEAAGSWLRDQHLADALHRRFIDGSLRERQLALLALAHGQEPVAADLVGRASRAEPAALRASAATAAGRLGQAELLAGLRLDPEPAVRVAALAAGLAGADERVGRELVVAALGDTDPVVRATALDWLGEHPRLPAGELRRALERAAGDALDDARRAAVAALRARAAAEPAERATVLSTLQGLATDREWLLRRAAAEALSELGEPAPPLGEAGRRLPVAAYRDLLLSVQGEPEVILDTARGAVALRLACAQAPLTCANFLSLVRQGFYDGLLFHRVVPDFVVQTGDPRGDGTGGPGWTVSDELNPLRYDGGVVGMALSGPDTGGSQFFVTLSHQPHLDGAYTAFGRVVAGHEVLPLLEQGDRLLRARQVEGGRW